MYNGSQVMFRRAQACASDSARHADRAATEIRSGLSGAEPRQRERDSVIETVILAQAAAESYVNWIYLQADVQPRSTSWIGRWGGLRAVAIHLGRDACSLPSEYSRFFEELNAWRNYLLHGDHRARAALTVALKAQGRDEITDDAEALHILGSHYAATIIERAGTAFGWAAQRTGIQPPFQASSWISPDE